MQISATTRVVITDANILINLLHIDQLALLWNLQGYQFLLPIEVLNELTEVSQRACVDAAIEAKQIDCLAMDEIDALILFGNLIDLMGRGEAACLALATTTGSYLASDEKKLFRRKAIELIGEHRLLRTEGLLLEAIRCEYITLEQADSYKMILAKNRYVMPFASFLDLL